MIAGRRYAAAAASILSAPPARISPDMTVSERAHAAGGRAAGTDLAALLQQTASGDRPAFRALYVATAPKLFGIVLRIAPSRAVAEEILQDVYLRVWQRASSYAPESGRPMTWLASIARHRAIDAVRQRAEVTMPRDEEGESWLDRLAAPGDLEADLLGRDALRVCLGRLEPEHGRCLVLAYCEGLSREELAARFDRPVNTIKTWLHRGLAALRACLEVST